MKGTEHFREAERFLAHAELQREDWDISPEVLVAYAQVHAILAAAVSISNLVTVWGDIAGMMRADSELADAEPVPEVTPFGRPVEPLMMCNAGPADDGPERCHLAMGHDGLHEHVYGSRAVHWSTADELRTITPDYQQTTAAAAHSIYESTATDMHMEMPR